LPSPSLEWVHASAGLSRRFRTWFDKACKLYEELLKFDALLNGRLRRERLEELTGEEKTKFAEALMEYESLEDGLAKFVTSKPYVEFVGATDEDLAKWVGDEIVSLGYCGFRERSAQYWLWDLRAEKLPYEKKVRQILDFYDVSHRMRVPSQEQAENMLFEFLENIKKWPRDQLVWLVRNFYPLTDDTGGFWVVTRKIVELESLRDAWEDKTEGWKRDVESALKKTPEFDVLKTVLASEWDAEKYLRNLAEDLEKEFLDKHGMVTADIEKAKEEFYDRAVALLRERVAPEEKLREVYEQIKPLIPTEKVELTRAGLWKAIRWLFLHPAMSLDAFASAHVFPLGFTTEEARAIALKIAEKVTKILVYPPSVAAPPKFLEKREFFERIDAILRERVAHYVEGEKSGFSGTLHYEAPQFEEEYARIFSVNTVFAKFRDEIEKEKATAFDDYSKSLRPEHYLAEVVPNRFDIFAKRLVEKMRTQLLEEAVKKARPAAPVPPIEFVKVRFLKDMPAIVGADMKVYGPFAKADVVELPKVNADIIVKQEIATYTIAPPELPSKEIDALRTVVKVKADDLGLEWTDEVWSRFWKEYEARARELWATRGVTYIEEEIENVLKAVAIPITPPVVKRERIRRPRVEVPVEAPAEVFVSPVTIPRVPISKLPFPRAPSTEEQAILWDAFRYEMARLGQDPFRWRENFKMHVLDRPYPDWATVAKNFNDFVEAIRTEKPFRLLPLVTLPMPWREEEEQRKYDAILHFIATKLYASMDELLHALYTYGMEVTEDDIKKAVKKGFAEKNLWLTSVPKQMLESLIAEKLG